MSLRSTTMVLLLLIIGVLSGVVAGKSRRSNSGLVVRKQPRGSVLGSIVTEQGVLVTGRRGRWARVRIEGWVRVRD